MKTKIDKFQEAIDKIKQQGKAIIITKEQFAKDMDEMNDSVEKTREEFVVMENNAINRAADLIVR